MTFPVYFHVFGHAIHPHVVMEMLAYTVGFQFYLLLRRRRVRAARPVVERAVLGNVRADPDRLEQFELSLSL